MLTCEKREAVFSNTSLELSSSSVCWETSTCKFLLNKRRGGMLIFLVGKIEENKICYDHSKFMLLVRSL